MLIVPSIAPSFCSHALALGSEEAEPGMLQTVFDAVAGTTSNGSSNGRPDIGQNQEERMITWKGKTPAQEHYQGSADIR